MDSLIKNQKGQSLIEMLIALFILVVALIATITLMVTSINASRESKNKLIGTNLAREGIEAVRNIRDSNWIDPIVSDWDDGLTDVIEVTDYTAIPIIDGSSVLSLDFSVNDIAEDNAQIFLGGNDYLQGIGLSVSAVATTYSRILYLNPICQDGSEPPIEQIVGKESIDACTGNYKQIGLRVISEVHWSSPKKRNVILEERLYDWQVL